MSLFWPGPLFWMVSAITAAAVLAVVLFPLLRRRGEPPPDRAAYDVAVYKDQLAEVERDVERGLIDPSQAEAARLEIKRRMLAETATAGESDAAPRLNRSPALAAALAVAVAGSAFGLYGVLGAPGVPDVPLAARGGSSATSAADAGGDPSPTAMSPSGMSMEEAVAQLQRRMEADPERLEGWLLLGRSYLALERYAEGAEAYRRAVELSGARPDVAADYGEALVAVAEGQVTAEAAEMFRKALARAPADPKSRYYLALAAAQRGDLRAAAQGWIDVVALSPADAPWLATVRQQIGQAAAELGVDPGSLAPSAEVAALAVRPGPAEAAPSPPGPTDEEMAAAAEMSAEERTAMIRSMVDRLADRLERQPEDREGWLRLARAYDVLGEDDKAQVARARAEALAGD